MMISHAFSHSFFVNSGINWLAKDMPLNVFISEGAIRVDSVEDAPEIVKSWVHPSEIIGT
jgi:hypothetical protein